METSGIHGRIQVQL